MLKNYFKIALRRLRSDRAHTLINVLGLALGITSCLVIYIFVRYELSFDSFHTNSDNTYRINEQSAKADGIQYWSTTAYPLAEAIRQDLQGVQVTQTAGPVSRIISSEDSKGNVQRFEENRLMFADKNYLQTFDFGKAVPGGIWLAGDAKNAFQVPNAVVLTKKLADRYFAEYSGDYRRLLGKILKLNNNDPLVVSGVILNSPHNTNLLFEMLVNYDFFKANNQYQATNWSGNYQGTTYVTLPSGVSPEVIESQLVTLKGKYMNAEDNRRITYVLQPVADIHTNTLYESSQGSYAVSQQMLWVLGSLAVFLILIASFNFINLTTAQASRRSKEVGVRKVVGSTQKQLFGQFIGETFIVASLAGLISAVSLQLLLSWLNKSLAMINLDLHPDITVLLFGIGLVLLVAFLAGFYPAIVLSKFQPIKALKNISDSGQRFTLRKGLIVLQFCITYVLLVATFVASRQMDFFTNKDLGFAREAVITINGPRNESFTKLDVFRHQLLQNPSISDVSFSSGAPITEHHMGTDFRLKSESDDMKRQAEMKVVDLGYQSLFGLKTIAGHWFKTSNIVPDGSAFNGFVVNETMVKILGLTPETAIGKVVTISEGEAPILGVVKDFHNVSLQQAIRPCVMMCWNAGFYGQMHVRFQSGVAQKLDLPQALRFIEKNWKQTFPSDVYQYSFLNESLAKRYIVEKLVFDSFRIFAAISIFIACLGLFGLITFTANQRTKEIGVRKVLGASVTSIVTMLSKDFLKLVVIAIIIASPIAWYGLNQWLQNFQYTIGIEWWLFVASAFLAIGIALLTVSFQCIKSALMNPVKALKSD